MNAEAIEAVVLDEYRAAVCKDCDGLVRLNRIRVTAPARCAGIKLWVIPQHDAPDGPCPGRGWR